MSIRIITPAAALAVSLEEAKISLREDGTDKDALITAWIKGITGYVKFYTRRALIYETVELTLDEFPNRDGGGSGVISLDGPPTVSVQSIVYLDADGQSQTLDPQDYFVDAISEPGYVVVASGKEWPVELDRINCLTVTFTRGYSADSSGIPEGIKLYILAKLSEQFDPAARVEKDTVQSSFIDHLLDEFKVYG